MYAGHRQRGQDFPWYARQEDLHDIDGAEIVCSLGTLAAITNGLGLLPPGQTLQSKAKPIWASRPFRENAAVAVAQNVVVVSGVDRVLTDAGEIKAETYGIAALDLRDGKSLWRAELPAAPVGWGLAINWEGCVLVSLRDGRVLCFEPKS